MSTTQITAEPTAEVRRRAFSITETAKILGVSRISIRRLINRGLLRANRTLRHLRISESEIDRFLAR
jgi:excisionase family DNA binding protein